MGKSHSLCWILLSPFLFPPSLSTFPPGQDLIMVDSVFQWSTDGKEKRLELKACWTCFDLEAYPS